MNVLKALSIVIFMGLLMASCKKFLEKSPSKKLSIPETVRDLQGLLNWDAMTQAGNALPDIGTDDYYIKPTDLDTRNEVIRNAYSWEKDIFRGASSADWTSVYEKIYRCNVVLDGLKIISPATGGPGEWEFAKGNALFCRALFFYGLAETFGYPFKPASAAIDMGIPLRLSSVLDEPVTRASVKETFDQIVADLSEAKDLLPDHVDILHRHKPSKAAAYALLARVYLTMQDYDKAYENADKSLQLYSTLVDYSPISAISNRSFPGPPNELAEITYTNYQISYLLFHLTIINIDTFLYASYDTNDKRRVLYFSPSGKSGYYKGQYTGTSASFCGIATDEVYLIKAECLARKGNTQTAMDVLNVLLKTRWVANKFTPLTAPDADSALRIILQERRKELIFRGIRWSDLRRLNQDPRFAKPLVRILDTRVCTLPANHPNYVYPIPDNEIQLSGIEQNPRQSM